MSVLAAYEDLQTFHALRRELVLRKHTLNSVFDDSFWELFTYFCKSCVLDSTRETTVAVVNLASFLVSGNNNIFSVDNYNVVTAVDVRSKAWLVLTGQVGCNLSCNAT